MFDVHEGTGSRPDGLTAKGVLRAIGEGAFGIVDFVNASMSGMDHYEDSVFTDQRPLFAPLDTAGVGFIVASGNHGVNLTEAFVTNPIDCYALTSAQMLANFNCKAVWSAPEVVILAKDAQLKDNFLWVGAVALDLSQPQYLQYDGTPTLRVVGGNVPGSDADIQARFLVALGVDINGPINSNNTDYFRISGTSHAAPVVTGAAALVKSQHPTASNEAVLQILLDSADSSFTGYDPELHGQGLLDIEAALVLADNTVF
jgi:subtilisin family serine protease